ncbi:phosphodiester glycosidase family protein [Ferrovibrio sp.]|jgi:hypothetical protein|uniref:phosphodiester glycosidase family protein n=1 Tax=Ferrovibrio sp. TaxID=1917215 RepID=UPI0035B11B1E
MIVSMIVPVIGAGLRHVLRPADWAIGLRASLFAVLLGLAGAVAAPSSPAYAVCGEDLQPPCQVERARAPCWSCLGSFCASCFYKAEECNHAELTVQGGLCKGPPSTSIPRPLPVDFWDGPNHVTQGYYAIVDLAAAWIVIPNLDQDNSCKGATRGGVLFPSPMRTVPQDQNMLTVPDWAETSLYGSRLAINGSFFEVNGYSGGGDLHSELCTFVYGYTLSNRQLVRQEEQIKAYSMGRPPVFRDPGTLVFYTPGSPRYADIRWFPMFPSDPFTVPANFQNAISGTQLLRNGAYVGDGVAGPDPACRLARTAVGLSIDGRQLIMVVVNPGDHGTCSQPVAATTLGSLATYMKSLGAENAIALDGGGSSQMFYTDYRSGILRSLPSDTVWPKTGFDPNKKYYRPVGNFLGIR